MIAMISPQFRRCLGIIMSCLSTPKIADVVVGESSPRLGCQEVMILLSKSR